MPSKTWRKKYKCKKNKGDHSWYIDHISNRITYFGRGIWGEYTSGHPSEKDQGDYVSSRVEWRCSACNKHDTEWLGERKTWLNLGWDKKKDPFRPHSPMVK